MHDSAIKLSTAFASHYLYGPGHGRGEAEDDLSIEERGRAEVRAVLSRLLSREKVDQVTVMCNEFR